MQGKKAIVIFVPVPQLKAYQKIQVRLVRELEKKFSGKHVVFIAQVKKRFVAHYRVTLVVVFGFLPKNFGRWWAASTNSTFHSMKGGSMEEMPRGGGDTQTLPYVKEFELFALIGCRDAGASGANVCA